MSETVRVDRETWKVLTGQIQPYDEMGFPDEDGEYDCMGFPLLILKLR